MKKFRKIIFWCHLPVGVIAGVVILIMCVTGVLLSYEKTDHYVGRHEWLSLSTSNCRAQRLPIETLIAKARDTRGNSDGDNSEVRSGRPLRSPSDVKQPCSRIPTRARFWAKVRRRRARSFAL